jgi:DNA-binding NtrC family response regulator
VLVLDATGRESVAKSRENSPGNPEALKCVVVQDDQTVAANEGPRGAAAKLGIPPSTLESKIKQLRIEKSRFTSAS